MKTGFIVEGKKYGVEFSKSAKVAAEDLGLTATVIGASIMAIGQELGAMEHKQKIIVIDKLLHSGIVARLDKETSTVEVLAVVNEKFVYVKEGMKVETINEWSH